MTYRAAIVGRAATTALGADLASTWAALAAGHSALAAWPSSAGGEGGAPWCARIVDAREGPEEDSTLRLLGRHGAWLELVARRAHEEAGLRALPREDVGLYVALGMVDSPPEELAPAVLASRDASGALDLERFYAGGFRALHPLWPLSMLGNVAAGHVAIGLDIRGDNIVLASDASAGMRAFAEALRALDTGAVRAAVVGGAAEPVSEASLVRRRRAATLYPAHATSTDVGGGAGEGAAVLALEAPAAAAARGVPVLGWLSGAAARFVSGAPWPAAGAAALAALESAQVVPSALDLVILCGDSPWPGGQTLLQRGGRSTEPGLLDDLLASGARPRFVSLAGALGDLLGAGPALGAALALDMFAVGAPPQARTTHIDVEGERSTARTPRRALVVVSSAEGGAGALLVEAP